MADPPVISPADIPFGVEPRAQAGDSVARPRLSVAHLRACPGGIATWTPPQTSVTPLPYFGVSEPWASQVIAGNDDRVAYTEKFKYSDFILQTKILLHMNFALYFK